MPAPQGNPGPGLVQTRTRIKICGLTRAQDVDAAVAAGADAIGLVRYERSPRHVSLDQALALAQRLPAFVTPVLLYVNASAEAVQADLQQLPQACPQFHGDEPPALCLAAAAGRPYLRAARIPLDPGASFDLLAFAQQFSTAQALLLDAHVEGYGGAGKAFDWSRIPTNVNAHLVLSGGLTPANVGDGIAQVRPRALSLAVDVSSGVEQAKGLKDAGKIREFVAAVRAADASLAGL
jgi:phosphoribosylanthranilate isomerase